jgi:hypothetical protein
MSASIKTFADFEKFNFFRTPSWRWERLRALVSGGNEAPKRCTRRDDDKIRTAKTFITQLHNADAVTTDRLKFQYPGLFLAFDFYKKAQEQPDAAMFLESRVLAGQSAEEIGKVMGVLPDTVTWYCDLFFDVVPYLERRDWIVKHVIAPAMLKTATSTGVFKDSTVAHTYADGTLKLFAYFGGPIVVDVMIGGLQSGKRLTDPDKLTDWFDGAVGTVVRRRTLQAAQSCEINKYNVFELMAVHTRIVEIANSVKSSDQPTTLLETHIRETLSEIPWAAGSAGEEMYEGTMLGRFDSMQSELRDSELLLLASGRTIDGATDSFPDGFPEPKVRKAETVITNVE